MISRAKERAARMQALLNDDGTITPAAQLPDGLLTQEIHLETEYLKALTAESVGEGLGAIRRESGLTGSEAGQKRGLSKGRLSQLESAASNPQLSTITEQAAALNYDVTIIFTPREKGRREVKVKIGQ
ncbi:helix-turn-helix domain-containing protein [Deinococcus arenicola]|uniref:Helix-turn-helix transcriptional regulator n=1 Tax=Deinococcus arenicola TaxID=2994950 RepID=A0ABU4DRX9_9DEIO|nr:helix-turn-helix transcriptional regulator [Deinococcus sp. ZS9-10]MDV6375188.1 helix-turn-helix transcriptional regulator [Deinococcus sp. ZS9-10]